MAIDSIKLATKNIHWLTNRPIGNIQCKTLSYKPADEINIA